MSVFSKIGSFFSIRDDEDDAYEDEYAGNPRVVPLSHAGRRGGTEVSVYSPRSYQDVVEIADSLRNRASRHRQPAERRPHAPAAGRRFHLGRRLYDRRTRFKNSPKPFTSSFRPASSSTPPACATR